MDERRGERLGWTGGLIGGSVWLIVAGLGLLADGRVFPGLAALGAFALVVGFVRYLAPWRHPLTPVWKLYLPFVAFMLLAFQVAVGFETSAVSSPPGPAWMPYQLAFFLLMPLAFFGNKRWADRSAKGDAKPAAVDTLE
jgi:hypothetical protein